MTRSRLSALLLGIIFAIAGAALLRVSSPSLGALTTGSGSVLLATGAAFGVRAFMGRGPDWIEPPGEEQ